MDMIPKLITDLGFLSSLLGFIALFTTTVIGWKSARKLNDYKSKEQTKVESATEADKGACKLQAVKNIDAEQKKHDTFKGKVSDKLFFVLTISFGLATGGLFMSIDKNTELLNRVKKIEDYLWPPSGPGGASPPSLSDQMNNLQDSISNLENLQKEIIDTVYEQVRSPSKELEAKVEQLTEEIKALKQQIEVMKRQQGGGQVATT